MEEVEVAGPSSSKSVHEGSDDIQLMHEKIQKFLQEEYEDGSKRRKLFASGYPLPDEELQFVINDLGRSEINMDDMDKEYKEFLNKYGTIYGGSFSMYGPTSTLNKISEIVSIQKGFQNRCIQDCMKEKIAKSCWLIAGIDQGDEYYISFYGKNKKNIYSMSHDGRSHIFAKGFMEFLDKFFDAYERKSEEDSYVKELYESEESGSN